MKSKLKKNSAKQIFIELKANCIAYKAPMRYLINGEEAVCVQEGIHNIRSKLNATEKKEFLEQMLQIQAQLDKKVYKTIPFINKNKYKSFDCDKEIEKIEKLNRNLAFEIGLIDLMISSFRTFTVDVSPLYFDTNQSV